MLLTATVMHLLKTMSVSLKFILRTPRRKILHCRKQGTQTFPLQFLMQRLSYWFPAINKTSFLLIICNIFAIAENITYVVSSCHAI